MEVLVPIGALLAMIVFAVYWARGPRCPQCGKGTWVEFGGTRYYTSGCTRCALWITTDTETGKVTTRARRPG